MEVWGTGRRGAGTHVDSIPALLDEFSFSVRIDFEWSCRLLRRMHPAADSMILNSTVQGLERILGRFPLSRCSAAQAAAQSWIAGRKYIKGTAIVVRRAEVVLDVREEDLAAERLVLDRKRAIARQAADFAVREEELRFLAHRILPDPMLARAYLLTEHPSLVDHLMGQSADIESFLGDIARHHPEALWVQLGKAFADFLARLDEAESERFRGQMADVFRGYNRPDLLDSFGELF